MIGLKKMAQDFSRDGLMKFHTYLASKGLMNANTVAARKAAANKMLAVLDESEAADLRLVSLEEVTDRFYNLNKNDFTPDSLSTYKSRLKSAVEDFIKHTESPASFKPQTPRTRSAQSKNEQSAKNGNDAHIQKHNPPAIPATSHENSFPIPLRDGVVVRVSGIPADMTKKEAQKIGNVMLALRSEERRVGKEC